MYSTATTAPVQAAAKPPTRTETDSVTNSAVPAKYFRKAAPAMNAATALAIAPVIIATATAPRMRPRCPRVRSELRRSDGARPMPRSITGGGRGEHQDQVGDDAGHDQHHQADSDQRADDRRDAQQHHPAAAQPLGDGAAAVPAERLAPA